MRSVEHHHSSHGSHGSHGSHSVPHQVKLTKNTLEPADYSFYQRMKVDDVSEVRGRCFGILVPFAARGERSLAARLAAVFAARLAAVLAARLA